MGAAETWKTPACRVGNHDRCGGVEDTGCDCACHPENADQPAPEPAAEEHDEELEAVDDEHDDGTPEPSPAAAAPPTRRSSAEAGHDAFAWEAPPSSLIGRASPLRDILAPLVGQLREKPHEWARLREYDKPTGASSAAQRARGLFPDITFTSRRIGGDTSVLWGCYEPAE